MKKTIKRIIIAIVVLIVAIFVFIGLYLYLKNDGIYVLSNFNNTELEWINKYATHNEEFPEETVIEEFGIYDDPGDYVFGHTQYLEATLLVPNDKIDVIFPENIRQYKPNKEDYIMDLSNGETDEEIQFCVWRPRTVVKWDWKTQRSTYYTVMQPSGEYTRVYVLVTYLGWNLYTYEKPE